MSEEIRREFEAWALSRGLSTKKLLPVSEIYYMESMQRAWEAWQAARNQDEWQSIETALKNGAENLEA